MRVDEPADLLLLGRSQDDADLHRRAARTVKRLVGVALSGDALDTDGHRDDDNEEVLPDSTFVVTDGAQTYQATFIPVPNGGDPLLMFVNELPPKGTDLWVVRSNLRAPDVSQLGFGEPGMICFKPGTMVATPSGLKPVQFIQPDDIILTKTTARRKSSGVVNVA